MKYNYQNANRIDSKKEEEEEEENVMKMKLKKLLKDTVEIKIN